MWAWEAQGTRGTAVPRRPLPARGGPCRLVPFGFSLPLSGFYSQYILAKIVTHYHRLKRVFTDASRRGGHSGQGPRAHFRNVLLPGFEEGPSVLAPGTAPSSLRELFVGSGVVLVRMPPA